MTTEQATRDAIGAAIGKIPSGCHIVTAKSKDGSKQVGMLASWVTQAGFEPPMITIAVHPERELYQVIEETGRFSVNVMSKENLGLMKVFAKYSPGQFEQVPCCETGYGFTLNDTIAVIQCELAGELKNGDHYVLLGKVVNSEMQNPDAEPFVHIRKSAFNY